MLFIGYIKVFSDNMSIKYWAWATKSGASATRVREDGGVEVACASATPPSDELRR
jgi:hypothetical protein